MIRAEQIPDEVVEVGAMQLPGMTGHQRYVRAAIAAALNAWPGVCKSESVLGLSKWIELPIEEEQ